MNWPSSNDSIIPPPPMNKLQAVFRLAWMWFTHEWRWWCVCSGRDCSSMWTLSSPHQQHLRGGGGVGGLKLEWASACRAMKAKTIIIIIKSKNFSCLILTGFTSERHQMRIKLRIWFHEVRFSLLSYEDSENLTHNSSSSSDQTFRLPLKNIE